MRNLLQVFLGLVATTSILPLSLGGRPLSSHDFDAEELQPFMRQMEIIKAWEKVNAGETQMGIEREPDNPWLKTCSGWMAIELCSTIFGSGLDEETAITEDVGYIPALASDYWVDYEDLSVTTSCRWFNPQNMTYKAIWRKNIGCTLVERLSEEEIRAQDLGNLEPDEPLDPNVPWPQGDGFFPERTPAGIDMDCVKRIGDSQFSIANRILNARAVVVIYKGELVYENYGKKITKDNPLLGWSATKSLTGSLIGIVTQGNLNIYDPAPVPEWNEDPNDPRQNITVDMMLRMTSGTRWTGDLPPTTECLFWSDANCAHVCAQKPLVTEPDTEWNYNSGSSYILSRIALEQRKEKEYNNFEWPKKVLFHKIKAHSMYIEYQPNGLFLGGAYGYGTARDWARFGLLHLRDGVWVDGERILPEGWSQYARTANKVYDRYAAHFWKWPLVDPDLFYAGGFRNQNVFIYPNQDLVVVRMAMPPLVASLRFDEEGFAADILSCVASS